ncbi:MAG TPA: O-antigen ligase family protein [Metabacillus sp.]|nr:O-antigen ligase family protein [Metabacillus sp.]
MKFKAIWKYLDYIIFFCFLFFCSIGLYISFIGTEKILLAVYGYFLFRVFYYLIVKKKQILISKGLTILVTYAVFSSLFSDFIFFSLRSSIMNLVIPTLIVYYMVTRYEQKLLILNIFLVGITITILSLFFICFIPNYGISEFGEWKGVFIHKNPLGFSMLFYSLMSIFFLFVFKKLSIRLLLTFISFIQIILLLNSESTTNILLFVLGISMYILIIILKNIKNIFLKVSFLAIFLSLLIPIIISTFKNLSQVFVVIGKDYTFTGRTIIWESIANMLNNHWLLGFGYDSFWVEGSVTKNYLDSIMKTNVPHAHNNYLDIIANFGVVGLLISLGCFVSYFYMNIRLVKQTNKLVDYFPIVLLSLLLIHAIYESYFIRPNSVSSVWCIYIIFYLGIKIKLNKLRAKRNK